MKKIFTNQSGSALLMTMLILTSVLTVSLGIASLVVPGVLMGRTQIRSTKAYFAAETGAERLLYAVRFGGFDPVISCVPGDGHTRYVDLVNNVCVDTLSSVPGYGNNYLLPSNNSSYYLEYTSSTPLTVFRSVGGNLGTNRVVEISY